jgi:hypothetical protein
MTAIPERGGGRYPIAPDKAGQYQVTSIEEPIVHIADIGEIIPSAASLTHEEHSVIYQFTLLWTLFEITILGGHASVAKIVETVQKTAPDVIGDQWFNAPLAYFINRYVNDGELFRTSAFTGQRQTGFSQGCFTWGY